MIAIAHVRNADNYDTDAQQLLQPIDLHHEKSSIYTQWSVLASVPFCAAAVKWCLVIKEREKSNDKKSNPVIC